MGSDQLYREIETLRERLSRHSAASQHINESLDVDTALRTVQDSNLWPPACKAGALTI